MTNQSYCTMKRNFKPINWYVACKKKILGEMTKIYLTHTTPYVILDKETGQIVEQSFRWNSPEAEMLYNQYQEMLELYPPPAVITCYHQRYAADT